MTLALKTARIEKITPRWPARADSKAFRTRGSCMQSSWPSASTTGLDRPIDPPTRTVAGILATEVGCGRPGQRGSQSATSSGWSRKQSKRVG